MDGRIRITALVGSYRKGGVIDRAVDEILAAAEEAGAETTRIFLRERQIEFCRNCRTCTQEEGELRGGCPLGDEMTAILDRIERSDALVLASPVNFGTVTAVMKRFIERLACYAWWPWGTAAPKLRNRPPRKRAVVVVSSAAPSVLIRLLSGTAGLLKRAAEVLGARTVGALHIGMAAGSPDQAISGRVMKKARRLGRELASPER